MADRYGTLGADSLTGTDASDYVSGGPLGNEALDTGDDTLNGGAGGTNVIYGWGGNDSIVGDADLIEDSIYGGDGNDTIQAPGNTDAFGQAGNDLIIASGSGGLFAYGGNGQDTILGGDGGDIIFDNDIDDVPNVDADILSGGEGNDRLHSRGGTDTLDGGAGDDAITFQNGRANGGDGNDLIMNIGLGIAFGDAGNDTVHGGSGKDRISGNADNDQLNGNSGNDVLNGGKGNDQLVGGDGADTIIGGGGADGLTGGAKADAFRWTALDRRNVDVVFDFGDGPDRLELSADALGDLLSVGALNAANFALDAATATAPQFIYRTATDTLVWDADGTGAGKAVSIAFFVNSPTLSAADIVIIA